MYKHLSTYNESALLKDYMVEVIQCCNNYTLFC